MNCYKTSVKIQTKKCRIMRRRCPNKVTLSSINTRWSPGNIFLLSCLFTALGHPTRTSVHARWRAARTNGGIKRRMVLKRVKTPLIYLPTAFHSSAASFTSKFTFARRWKWLIPKRPPKCKMFSITHKSSFTQLVIYMPSPFFCWFFFFF